MRYEMREREERMMETERVMGKSGPRLDIERLDATTIMEYVGKEY